MADALKEIAVAVGFHGLDILTGLLVAVMTKTLNSSKMTTGIFKKCGYLGCYALCFLIDYFGGYVHLELPFHVLPYVVLYAVVCEILSIWENLTKLNDTLAMEKLKDFIKKRRGGGSNGG